MRRRTFVGLFALIALAGCGDEDDPEEVPEDEEPEEDDPEPEPDDEGDDMV
jgi:predicted small lipoprotein YifL